MALDISIHDSVKQIVRLGYIQFDRVQVRDCIDELVSEMDELGAEYRQKYNSPADAMDRLQITRTLYRKIGLDPTKNRPSSEALLRRVLKGQSLYQINSVVDTCNLCSLRFLLSLGLYDVNKINGNIVLRPGKSGEGYDGIRKDFIHVAGRFTLVDDIGPFGNPSADSARTMITTATTTVLFVVFVPADYATDRLNEHLDYIERKVQQYHPCRTIEKNIIP